MVFMWGCNVDNFDIGIGDEFRVWVVGFCVGGVFDGFDEIGGMGGGGGGGDGDNVVGDVGGVVEGGIFEYVFVEYGGDVVGGYDVLFGGVCVSYGVCLCVKVWIDVGCERIRSEVNGESYDVERVGGWWWFMYLYLGCGIMCY